MKKEKVYKTFEVVLHPKPYTTKILAEFPWQAIKIAEDNYSSEVARLVLEDAFDDYSVKVINDTNGTNQPKAV